jgi:hypothetical protein
VLCGLTPALALATADLAEAALAARPLQVAVPIMTINDPASAHSRAHRLSIVVLPEVRLNAQPTYQDDYAENPGDDPPRNHPELISWALQMSYGLAEVSVNRYAANSGFTRDFGEFVSVRFGLPSWDPSKPARARHGNVRVKKTKVRGQAPSGLPAHLQFAGHGRSSRLSNRIRSDRADLLSLRTLRALACGELDSLVLLQAAETVSLDGGVVYEDVGGAVIRGDETIALVSVEPLHGALSHVLFSYGNDYRDPRTCLPGCCDSLPLDGGGTL